MGHKPVRTNDVATQIKNPELVEQRREQIVNAAIKLFVKNGFHKTTTREIAKASGFSIGSLYEYVASKEDILFLVCDSIHAELEHSLNEILNRKSEKKEIIEDVIREYFLICHRMSAHVLLMYHESKSLPAKWRKKIMETETRITKSIEKVLTRAIDIKKLKNIDKRSIELMGHNISVLGHMWSFRRWHLASKYKIEDYITLQTELIFSRFNLY